MNIVWAKPREVELQDDNGNKVAIGHFEVDGFPLVEGTRIGAMVLVLDHVVSPAALPETRLVP